MTLLDKMFGKKKEKKGSDIKPSQVPQTSLANDSNLIKVYDGYGRELFITKQEWKDKVLLGNLEKMRDDPNKLYGMLVESLHDGFAADIVPYAEHLQQIDSIPSRGSTILAIVYMDNNRLDDAERVMNEFLSKHGDEGVVLTNLAKVYSRRGNEARALAILWHALEVDPNQDNGLDWYAALHRDRGGEASVIEAYRRVAALPSSWRAQLWLARDALQRKDVGTAKTFYIEALSRAGSPVPADLLMQMSGDLGNNGFLSEIMELVEPHFDPALHGLQVGNNLIKANLELGRVEEARRCLDQLYAQKRHDWQDTLRFWDTELGKAVVTQRAKKEEEPLSVALLTVEGPLWARDASPFALILPSKSDSSRIISIFGSTVLFASSVNKPVLQLSDAPGRLSRILPLALAERIHLGSDAIGCALIPWAQNKGFALFGRPYDDQALCDLCCKGGKIPDYIIGVIVDATKPNWILLLGVLKGTGGVRIAEDKVEVDPNDPGPAVERLCCQAEQLLAKHADVHLMPAPAWYQIPPGRESSDYVLRLEQQLAITCEHLDFLKGGGLSGEHEMLDGILQLCVRQPANPMVRILLAQTLRQMLKVRPKIIPEYREKIDLLQRDHPLKGDICQLIEKTIERAINGEA